MQLVEMEVYNHPVTDAQLTGITLSDGNLEPTFDPSVREYRVEAVSYTHLTVVAANDIDRSMWLYIGNILKKILTSWWFILLVVIIVVLLILYFVMVVVYNKRRRKGKIPVRRKKGQTVKRRRR